MVVHSRSRSSSMRVVPSVCLFILGLTALIFIRFSFNGISNPSRVQLRRFDSKMVPITLSNDDEEEEETEISYSTLVFNRDRDISLPKQNSFSRELERRNYLPPKNRDMFPVLSKDRIYIVLYVHNRPQYLQLVVDSLSKVEGINETLLIVSHDGYYEEMNKVVEGIRFCQVKQIFAPYSPHLFNGSFPGAGHGDCQKKDEGRKCHGNPDQYGNHRSPKIVSLKHHWWWLMNWVWDGMEETKKHKGHILFIEEDHYIFPNAYQNIKMLTWLKNRKCQECFAANLAPHDVNFKGEGTPNLFAEKIGNVGYAFNRTVWRKMHSRAKEFCVFDDYNWDITLWVAVYPSFGVNVYTLRGPRRSAAHFGKCGLHQGTGKKTPCFDNGQGSPEIEDVDRVPNIDPNWAVAKYDRMEGYKAGFKGWGGWGDDRDHRLCLDFASMYLKF